MFQFIFQHGSGDSVWMSSTLGTSFTMGETSSLTNSTSKEGTRSFLNDVSDSTIASTSIFLASSTSDDMGEDGGRGWWQGYRWGNG